MNLSRQFDIVPGKILGTPITFVGAGSIGSFACLQLAKMGMENIQVIDHDVVSDVNIPNQFFRLSDVGTKKVDALKAIIKEFAGVEIHAVPEEYKGGTFDGIVISAVDSMKVRQLIWDNHKDKAFKTRLIVDPRMGALDAALYTVNPMNTTHHEEYEATLRDDSEAANEPCTAKATIFTVNLISGMVAKTVLDELKSKNPIKAMVWSIEHDDFNSWRRK